MIPPPPANGERVFPYRRVARYYLYVSDGTHPHPKRSGVTFFWWAQPPTTMMPHHSHTNSRSFYPSPFQMVPVGVSCVFFLQMYPPFLSFITWTLGGDGYHPLGQLGWLSPAAYSATTVALTFCLMGTWNQFIANASPSTGWRFPNYP